MNNPNRVFFFRHYWWIAPLAAGLPCWAIFSYSTSDNAPSALIALCAGVFSVIFFVQKQKGEDLQIFERLFVRFNERYAALHEKLQVVKQSTVIDNENIPEPLDAYFNLCSEEFLFFQEGRILPSVWQAWCRGMISYLQYPHILTYWRNQQSQGSHYGLTLEWICLGSALANPLGLADRQVLEVCN